MKTRLLLTLVTAATFCAASPSAVQDASDVTRAEHYTQLYCSQLGCVGTPVVTIMRPYGTPEEGLIVAHTTRKITGDGCVVHLSERVLWRLEVIAHEACHCALDYDDLTPYGYVARVYRSDREMKRREDRAHQCERDLMDSRKRER